MNSAIRTSNNTALPFFFSQRIWFSTKLLIFPLLVLVMEMYFCELETEVFKYLEWISDLDVNLLYLVSFRPQISTLFPLTFLLSFLSFPFMFLLPAYFLSMYLPIISHFVYPSLLPFFLRSYPLSPFLFIYFVGSHFLRISLFLSLVEAECA